jgi:hypothetical protein
MDFTHTKYKELLETLRDQRFSFVSFGDYLQNNTNLVSHKICIFRHDVEQNYINALQVAKILNKFEVNGTYFFRIKPNFFQPEIVREISLLGHEIGYHYDDLTQSRGDFQEGICRFERNLQVLRNIAPVKTICMHGSPLSRFDNKNLWMKYKYWDYGIIGDPYFDVDFDQIFYLSDTGRRWDGWKVSIRDKVRQQKKWTEQGLTFHSTNDIIYAARNGTLPDQIMFTFHPKRWSNRRSPWLKELVWQNLKNSGKRILVVARQANNH